MLDRAPARFSITPKLPPQRWHLHDPEENRTRELAQTLDLPEVLARVLIDRGFDTPESAQIFLNPETLELPRFIDDFPDLGISYDLIREMREAGRLIAICGDYDADGMTSTALLLRALRTCGANVEYAIPSRMTDGYGINSRIVRELHEKGVGLIITVDNGISAHDPVEEARELGMEIIVTDHHDLPPEIPLASAILNPKMTRADSPYRGMAGVGVAYMLAMHVAEQLGHLDELRLPLLELLTLGTIADLAPLSGVNRHWVKQGLGLLPHSTIPGIQALMQVSGTTEKGEKALKPDAIGFRLGPRINAVGRIGDPQLVIELLSTDDTGIALERAMQCEQINQTRQGMCHDIEREAIEWCETSEIDLLETRILVPLSDGWHHGVIGIVASRLVERYGVPVFICTYEDEEKQQVRGSARGIPEFNVFEALEYCKDLLSKHGGHPAAGGFSLPEENLEAFRSRLSEFACQCLEPHHLKPRVTIDSHLELEGANSTLYAKIDRLHPCGIGNPEPVFWTHNLRVAEQRIVGKGHLKLTVADENGTEKKAIAWRWGDYFPLPTRVDLAYKLRENNWSGERAIELEIVGARLPDGVELTADAKPSPSESVNVEEASVDDSILEDLKSEESLSKDSTSEDLTSEELQKEEAIAELSKSEDLTSEASTSEELQKEEAIAELSKSEDLTSEASTSEDSTSEEVSIDDAISEVPKSEDLTFEDSTAEELPSEDSNSEKASVDDSTTETPAPKPQPSAPKIAKFDYRDRVYQCGLYELQNGKELRIRNDRGQVLAVRQGSGTGLLGTSREDAKTVNVRQKRFFDLIKVAMQALQV
ncbi:single-stranded-DNA-specific exonuclease RecJ [Baaleninema simplex]|uniref:single-stranded-DNA-specific exonuclease RecJ n=1 Tax=Baaleninema simplex TaxID=2862350 RepID=UPI00034D7699|nr:single-stranded-DNA-specific exonuclease RecJ [Baaleninema simplex]